MIVDQYEYLKNILSDVRVVFDVGAKEGADTVQFLRIFPQAHVWAFDCADKAVQGLWQRFGNERRVTVVNQALLDHSGIMSFYPCTRPGSSSIYPVTRVFAEEAPGLSVTEVLCTTVDEYVQEREIERVDLLKIDVEGADYLVLQGCEQLLDENRIRAVFCELLFYPYYEGQHYYHEVIDLMVSRGFSLYVLYPQYWGGRLRYANALFM